MGRWSQYDEDEYRLPEDVTRVGYDADTQVYTYQDDQGHFWEGASGNRYGRLHRVGGRPSPPTVSSQTRNRVISEPPMTNIPDTWKPPTDTEPNDDHNNEKTIMHRITAPVQPLRRALTQLISSTTTTSTSANLGSPQPKRSLSQRLQQRTGIRPRSASQPLHRRSTLSAVPEKPSSSQNTADPKTDASEVPDEPSSAPPPYEKRRSSVQDRISAWLDEKEVQHRAMGRSRSTRGK